MAIKRPDIYEHNNPNLAIVDSDFVRGGGRVVANLTELYALANKIDQLKERVTKVYVISEDITYVLVNKLDITKGIFNSTAWKEESGGMSTVYTDGTTITGDGSENNPLVAQIPEEIDPIYSLDKDRLSNTSGTNTGDQLADNETITGSGSLNDPFIANIKVIESETPPLNPIQGLRWFNLTNGVEYTYLQGYWVDLNGNTSLQISHENLTDKNSEAAFQHVDTTTVKEALDEADKVALYDSVTGKIVLSNALNDIETILASI